MTKYGYLLPTRGAVLDAGTTTPLHERLQRDVLELAVDVETRGFDSVWVGDSILAKPRPEPLTTLAAIAGLTDDVALGTAVYLPTVRHPVHVAHQVATLDLLSEGRVALGMGVGRGPAVEDEYETFDLPYNRRGRLLDESLDVIAGLLEGDGVTYHGEFVDLNDVSLGIEPVGEVPSYVPYRTIGDGGEFPRHVRNRIVDHAGGWLPNSIPPESYRAGLESIRSFLSDGNREPDSFDPAFYLNAVIADTESVAIDRARTFLERYYPRLNNLSDDAVRQHGAFGPPGVVATTLANYREAGVEHFVVRFTAQDQEAQLDRFTDLVR